MDALGNLILRGLRGGSQGSTFSERDSGPQLEDPPWAPGRAAS